MRDRALPLLIGIILAGCARAPVLGEGVVASPPRPGRYSAAFSTEGFRCCSHTCAAHWSVASLALVLDPRGGATLCRAREGVFQDAEGEGVEATSGAVHAPAGVPVDRRSLDERSTHRGTWRRDGTWIAIDLEPRGTTEAREVLRCVEVAPSAAPAALPGRLLACRLRPDVDRVGYAASVGSLPSLVYLRAEPGLMVRWREREDWLSGDDVTFDEGQGPALPRGCEGAE